jgi:hypothetical protein
MRSTKDKKPRQLPGQGACPLGLQRLSVEATATMGTAVGASDFPHYAIAFFGLAQVIHPVAVPQLVPPRRFLVGDANVPIHVKPPVGFGSF